MKEILSIVKQLQSTSARTGKEAILKSHSSNDEFKQLLKYVYDPFLIYGVQKKKLDKLKNTVGNNEFNHLFEVFEYLLSNPTGRDVDVRKVALFIKSEEDEELQEFYRQCICKSLKTGASVSTINKIYGKGFISKFDVLLAKKFEDESHKVRGKEFVITEKLDGMRILARVEDGKVQFFTRQGQPVLQLVDIESEVITLPNGAYDGELLIANADDYKDRDVLQETLKLAKRDGEKKNLVFHMFDMITLDDIEEGKSKMKYMERKSNLIELIGDRFKWIKYVPNMYVGKDMDVIPELLEEMDSQGKEGLMLNLDGHWVGKRTDQLLKIKTMQTFDEVIVDTFEGEGKYQGMLGGLIVNYKGFPLKIGSGYSDEQRREFWESREKLIGRVVQVQYFRESQNQDGGLSVSFPVFKMIREIGKEVSYH